MFDTLHFEGNSDILQKCHKLVEEHNAISYKKVTFNPQTVEYRFITGSIKSTDPVSNLVVSCYESYSTQMYAIDQIKKIIDSTSYTNDNLSMNIDLSSDSIISLLSKLSFTHDKFLEYRDLLIANLYKQAEVCAEYIVSACSDKTDIKNVIDVIFVCMMQKGISHKIDVDEEIRPFISVGSKLIELLFKNGKLSEELVLDIRLKNDSFKQTILHNLKLQTQNINKLQTFGLVPDEGPNRHLSEIINTLFGLKMPHVDSIENDVDSVRKALQLMTADTGLETGLIIILSPNADIFFDMSTLFNVSQPLGSKGITSEMVKMFDLIKREGQSAIKQSTLLTINVDPDRTKLAYVLWTNNYKTFKSKSSPISNLVIKKLVRKAPSSTIESYNTIFEQIIGEHQVNDAIMFNKVKYMSFTHDGGEDEFLDELQKLLVSYVLKYMQGLKNGEILNAITKKFTDGLFDILDSAKIKLGIMSQELPAHCHIIYGNISKSIVGKIIRDLSTLLQIEERELNEIIKLIVKTNDNIYSRVVAGYYLHIA